MRRWRQVKWVSSSSPRLAAVYEGSFSPSLQGEDSTRMHRHIEKSIQFIEMKGGRFVLSNVSRQKSKGTPFHEDRKCHNYLAQSKLTSFSLTRMNMFIQINRERKRTNISFLSISISKFYFQYAKSICLSKNKHNLHDKLCLLRSKRADAS